MNIFEALAEIRDVVSTSVTKYSVTLTSADTQYTQVLPHNTRKFRIHLRDYAAFRLAYIDGRVASSIESFESIPAGSEKYEDNLRADLTLYIASPAASKTAEVEVWY